MTNKLITFRNLVTAGMLCLVAASCSDEMDTGSRLPEGVYPMTFSAAVDGQAVSRATTDNTWTGTEEVAIQIGSEVKKYTAASNGNLTIKEGNIPFYWQSTEAITVNAWYPYNGGNKPADGDLRVKADQSQVANYQASDYLEAADATVPYNQTASLVFKHRTAKVVVTLVAGDGIANLSGVAVTFVNQTGVDGNGTEVTPKTETGATTTYTALLIPQQMQGKQFIKVVLGGYEYFYTPTGDDANLQAGQQHTYTITVKKTGLEVTTSSPSWSGGEETVTGTVEP